MSSHETLTDDLEGILSTLDRAFDELPRQALLDARARRDEIVPRLIRVLEDAAKACRAGDFPDGYAHYFALFLLWEFRAREALPAIVDVVSLPGDSAYDLFGNALNEHLARILASLAVDQPDAIRGLLRDREAADCVRGEAARSYLYLVRDGVLTREQVVETLRESLREALDQDDRGVTGYLVARLCDYGPAEARDEITEAFRRGSVDESWIDRDDAERLCNQGAAALTESVSSLGPTQLEGAVSELAAWFEDPSTADLADDEDDPGEFEDEAAYQDESDWPLPERPAPLARENLKVGRNDPCPCGSGQKFKRCCGKRR